MKMLRIDFLRNLLNVTTKLQEKDKKNIKLVEEVKRLEYEVKAEEQREGILERRKQELDRLEHMDKATFHKLDFYEKKGYKKRVDDLRVEIEKLEKTRQVI